jgi:hypothetical protein
MKKANTILVFGTLFIALGIGYAIMNIHITTMDPTQEMILEREKQVAFISTTFWSGIILIAISIFLKIKTKIYKK